MYQREVDVDMLNAVKSMLPKINCSYCKNKVIVFKFATVVVV